MERASPLCTALRTGSPGSFPRARRALAPAAPGPIGHCIRRHHSILRPRFRHAAPALSPTSSSPHLFPALTRAVRSSRSVPLANINVTPLASRPVPCPSASDPSCAGLPNPPRGNRHSHRTPAAQSQYQRAGRHTHPRGLSLSPRTHALVAPSGLARSPGFARCVTRRRPRHRHAHHVAARRCTPPPPAMAHTPPPAVIQRRPPRRSARRCPHATARHRPPRRSTPLHAGAHRHTPPHAAATGKHKARLTLLHPTSRPSPARAHGALGSAPLKVTPHSKAAHTSKWPGCAITSLVPWPSQSSAWQPSLPPHAGRPVSEPINRPAYYSACPALSPRTHALVAPSGLARLPGLARCVTRPRPPHRHAHHAIARRRTPPPPATAHRDTPPPATAQRRPPHCTPPPPATTHTPTPTTPPHAAARRHTSPHATAKHKARLSRSHPTRRPGPAQAHGALG